MWNSLRNTVVNSSTINQFKIYIGLNKKLLLLLNQYYVLNENSCLHYLLPPPRVDVPYSFRCQKKIEPPMTRTYRFSNSFIIYGAKNYQT